METSLTSWRTYQAAMARISGKAAEALETWVQKRGGFSAIPREELLDYAYALATKYGEASGTLAAEYYDAAAAAQGADVPPAEPAETADYHETAKTVNGALRQGEGLVPGALSRLVKQVGADTTLKNAERDGAEFAWIPWGTETCAFCIALAAQGWQRTSRNALQGGHAEHIHQNCYCEYAVRFDGKSGVAGYDPGRYLRMYESAEGDSAQEKLNALRRMLEAPRRAEINERKRAAYERAKADEGD